jgi:hypothetical protein
VTYPPQLRDGEAQLFAARHARSNEPAQARGVALSGGGIRSATFGLGVFHASHWRSATELGELSC